MIVPKSRHPSGRPVRRERRVGRPSWNYPNDPAVVYATPRLRPQQRTTVDAVAYKYAPAGDECHGAIQRQIGFVELFQRAVVKVNFRGRIVEADISKIVTDDDGNVIDIRP